MLQQLRALHRLDLLNLLFQRFPWNIVRVITVSISVKVTFISMIFLFISLYETVLVYNKVWLGGGYFDLLVSHGSLRLAYAYWRP